MSGPTPLHITSSRHLTSLLHTSSHHFITPQQPHFTPEHDHNTPLHDTTPNHRKPHHNTPLHDTTPHHRKPHHNTLPHTTTHHFTTRHLITETTSQHTALHHNIPVPSPTHPVTAMVGLTWWIIIHSKCPRLREGGGNKPD